MAYKNFKKKTCTVYIQYKYYADLSTLPDTTRYVFVFGQLFIKNDALN